jgi:hypothetical protein
MNRSSTRRINIALATVCLALAAIALAMPAGAATVHFQSETLKAYEGQLHHHEVHALTFHSGSEIGHLHISLSDGSHMTVAYPAAQQGKLVTQAREAGARVKVATVKPAAKATAVHHKLRYIAGGILVVVILVVLVVLLVGRRRAVAVEESEGQA